MFTFFKALPDVITKIVLHDGEIWNYLAIFELMTPISIVYKTESDFQNTGVLKHYL